MGGRNHRAEEGIRNSGGHFPLFGAFASASSAVGLGPLGGGRAAATPLAAVHHRLTR